MKTSSRIVAWGMVAVGCLAFAQTHLAVSVFPWAGGLFIVCTDAICYAIKERKP